MSFARLAMGQASTTALNANTFLGWTMFAPKVVLPMHMLTVISKDVYLVI